MPFVFIHGVNTRASDDDYGKNIAARDKLLQRRLLDPLARSDARFEGLPIVNPYWGDAGVRFRWGMASLPDVSVIEHLGVDESATPEADAELAETVRALAGAPIVDNDVVLEGYGGDDSQLQRAAEADLTRFLEAVLAPLLTSELRLGDLSTLTDADEGRLQALVAMAADDVSNDTTARQFVDSAASDGELMEFLGARVAERLQELAVAEPSSAIGSQEPLGDQLEVYGSAFDSIKYGVRELFDRMKGAPGRASTIPVLDLFRQRFHDRLARFLGDVFVYLNEREPIVSKVLTPLQQAIAESPDSPLVIVTHSMGGNILYDILTWYAKDLHPDVWVSVGGQVAQFEEMKLFKASDPAVEAPQKVSGLKPRLGYWLNVYDPADVLSFKAGPVFADVDADVPYLTGTGALGAHGAYFGRSSFYRLVRIHLEKALS